MDHLESCQDIAAAMHWNVRLNMHDAHRCLEQATLSHIVKNLSDYFHSNWNSIN